jgi:hypothetical protein
VLAFELGTAGLARLTVYDMLGRLVARLVDGKRPAGPTAVTLETARLPAGAYLVRLDAEGRTVTTRLVVAH